MATINSRVKELRQSLNLTHKEFAEQLGLSRRLIGWLEQDGNTVSVSNIRLMCVLYGVREQWLRDGIGDMYNKTDESAIADLAREHNLSDNDVSFLRAFMGLTDEQRANYLKWIQVTAAINDKLTARA